MIRAIPCCLLPQNGWHATCSSSEPTMTRTRSLAAGSAHTDQLALVVPFATQLDDLLAIVDSTATRSPGSDNRRP